MGTSETDGGNEKTKSSDSDKPNGPNNNKNPLFNYDSFFWNLFRGQMTLTLSWCALQYFAEKFNGPGPNGRPPDPLTSSSSSSWSKLLSEAAYGAYVFHWMVWPMVLASY